LSVADIVPGSPPAPPPTLIISLTGQDGLTGQDAAQEIIGVREGQPPSGAILFWYEFIDAQSIALATCRMRVGIAPASDYVCPITTGGIQVGQWLVPAGQIDGVLTLSQVTYAAYQDLKVAAPLLAVGNISDTLIIMALEALPS
jgi:hypothetical protein